MSENNPMFRYLENYIGKYRVLARYDLDTDSFPEDEDGQIDDSFDDLYIPCSVGEIRASYHDGLLVWYTDSGQQGRNIYKKLKEKYPKLKLEEDDCGTYDYYIYFEPENINKVATIVKPRTSGAKIKPFSIKNLPKPVYVQPEKEEDQLRKLLKKLDSATKMFFVMKICNEFDEQIQAVKGKKYDVGKERKKTRLKKKAFISYVGMWDQFMKYAKQRYGEEFGNETSK